MLLFRACPKLVQGGSRPARASAAASASRKWVLAAWLAYSRSVGARAVCTVFFMLVFTLDSSLGGSQWERWQAAEVAMYANAVACQLPCGRCERKVCFCHMTQADEGGREAVSTGIARPGGSASAAAAGGTLQPEQLSQEQAGPGSSQDLSPQV